MSNVPSRLTKAKAQLVIHHPFFASILLRRELKPREDIPTMGVNKRGDMFYNPKWVETLTTQQGVFVLAHEVMHVALQHFARTGGRNAAKANKAQDCVINETLVKSGVGEFIAGGMRYPGAEDMTWEQVYDLLPEDEGRGDAGENGGIGDDILDEGEVLTEAEETEIREKIKVELAQAAQAARMQGKLPAGLERLVDDMLRVRVPYHEILRRFMSGLVNDDYSWNRPNRRFVSQGVYLPGSDKVPRMGTVGYIADTSGSISEAEHKYSLGHINAIMEQCIPEKFVFVPVDSKAYEIQTFTELPADPKFMGGGGTDMREGFRALDETGEVFDCVLLFTDGYTPWPDPSTLPYPVVVICTTDAEVPIGEVIRFSMEGEAC